MSPILFIAIFIFSGLIFYKLNSLIYKRKSKITEKSCLCVGLVNSSYLESEIPIKGEKQGVVVCPGPNLAYFDKEVSLADMVQHIYGEKNVMPQNGRPNLFINELKMYVDYLKNEIEDFSESFTNAQVKKWKTFKTNLLEGVSYYEKVFAETAFFKSNLEAVKLQLANYKSKIAALEIPENRKA